MDDPIKQLRERALGLLTRREHSRRELATKLRHDEVGQQQVHELLDSLADQGLQSDSRYAQSLVRSLIGRGQGRLRIRQALRQKGIADSEAEEALLKAEVDWFELAERVQQKRFGDVHPGTPKEQARQIRFLLYRGFDQEQARHALDEARKRGQESD